MAIWQKPYELADGGGKPTGRYRVCEHSDEDIRQHSAYRPMCKCENGHATEQEAINCIKPKTADDVMREFSKDEIIKTLFEMECEKLDLNPEGLLLCFQLEFVKVSKENANKSHGRKKRKGI